MAEQDRTDEFAEALGTYIGPADYDEVVRAIATTGSTPGYVLIVRATTSSDELAWHVDGHLISHIVGWEQLGRSDDTAQDDGERSDTFIIGGRQEPILGSVLVHRDIPLVLDFDRGYAEHMDAERYSGGVRLHVTGGATLTIVFWAGIAHETEGGDVAPGLGPFTGEFDADEDDA